MQFQLGSLLPRSTFSFGLVPALCLDLDRGGFEFSSRLFDFAKPVLFSALLAATVS